MAHHTTQLILLCCTRFIRGIFHISVISGKAIVTGAYEIQCLEVGVKPGLEINNIFKRRQGMPPFGHHKQC
jgi:hypothetical protein